MAGLEQDADFQQELKRLSNSFGIGVIKLNVDNPDDSEVVLPAKTKESLDWDTINKLCNVNSDFRGFIENVKDDAKITKIQKMFYDSILEVEELKLTK